MDRAKKVSSFFCIVFFLFVSNAYSQDNVGALGRIVPGSGLVKIIAAKSGVIEKIVVKEGDRIAKGDPMVILRRNPVELAELAQAELNLRDANENGAKAIGLQKLKIEAAQNELAIAQKRYSRFGEMGEEFASFAQMEEREYQLKSAGKNLEILNAELEHMTLTNRIAARRAAEQLKAAQETINLSVLTAPFDGTIVDIFQFVGEMAGMTPTLTMANLETMDVVAEISESDILRLEPGMKATITSSSLPAPIQGSVETIGRFVTDNSKIVNIRIRLDESKISSRLINMEVNVTIDLKAN